MYRPRRLACGLLEPLSLPRRNIDFSDVFRRIIDLYTIRLSSGIDIYAVCLSCRLVNHLTVWTRRIFKYLKTVISCAVVNSGTDGDFLGVVNSGPI
jgi:hypothetical protein